jgi:hypothetical protein
MPLVGPARKAKSAHVTWFPEAVEAPRVTAPDTGILARRQRRYRSVVWICVILTPVATLALLVSATNHKSRPAVVSSSGSENSAGKVAATVQIEKWLKAIPDPLPNGRIVSWDGAYDIQPPAAKGGSPTPAVDSKVEVNRFTVQGDPGIFETDVEVALTPSGPVALGGPSLIPVQLGPSAGSPATQSGPWPGLITTSSVPSAVSQAVQSWANAYTSGNPATLALAVGDPDTTDHYTPLSGVAAARAAVVDATRVGEAKTDQMSVEVTLAITWTGQPASSGAGNGPSVPVNPQGPQTTLDLLVERANTAAPAVVAWGPPGSGPTLIAYRNGHQR